MISITVEKRTNIRVLHFSITTNNSTTKFDLLFHIEGEQCGVISHVDDNIEDYNVSLNMKKAKGTNLCFNGVKCGYDYKDYNFFSHIAKQIELNTSFSETIGPITFTNNKIIINLNNSRTDLNYVQEISLDGIKEEFCKELHKIGKLVFKLINEGKS